jgi:hypothetical protein
VTIMYACISIIAADDLGSSTAQKTELTSSNTAHDIYVCPRLSMF